jgi:D-arabinose 1-dehydrogenase-like Zn-dependent alcohol dehydrogenase
MDGPCLVVGAGPVGILVAEILRSADLQVLIVERNGLRAKEAHLFGYDVFESLDDLVSSVAGIVDCAADPAMVGHELELMRPHGMYLSVGYCTVPEFDLGVVARRELTIRGIRSGTPGDLREVLRLAAERVIRLPTPSVWSLDDVNEALHALRDGVVAGKAIVVNGALRDQS